MTSKKSMIFLISLVLISITIMTTYYFDKNSPSHLSDGNVEGSQDPDTNETGNDQIREQLRVAVAMDTDEYLKLVALSLEFETYQRGLKIDVEMIDEDDVYSYYKKALQMGDAPDIMLLDNAWINEFAALSYLAQLDEVVSSNMNEMQIAPMVAQAKWNGLLWAVPKEVNPYVIAWNSDRLAEVGAIDMPETVDNLLAINYMLSQTDPEKTGFFLDFDDPYAFISAVWMLEGQFIDLNEENEPLHNEETFHKLQALLYPSQFEVFAGMVDDETEAHDGEVMIQMSDDTEVDDEAEEEKDSAPEIIPLWSEEDFDAWQLLNDGTIAMMLTTVKDYQTHAADHVKMTALPLYDESELGMHSLADGSWLAGKSFAVSSKSERKKEAFDWIQSMTTAEAQIDLMHAGGGLPAMVSAYGDRLKTMDHFEVIVKAIEHGQVIHAHPELPEKLRNLREQLVALGSNEMSLHDLLNQFAIELKDIDR